MKTTLAVLAALLLAPAALADVPPVLVPPHADSVNAGVAPAPLLQPGRPSAADSLYKSPEQLGREQYALGRQLERDHQPAAAIAAYRNAVRLAPRLPGAHYRMGVLFTAVSQHRVAAREYALELVASPGHRDASRGLALERAQLGDTASAISLLEQLTGSDPRDEPSWRALGFAYSTAGRPLQGERALRSALALDPQDADAWRDLGAVLAAQKREADARAADARAARLAPRDAGVWINLGNLEQRAGRPAQALDDYGEALRRDSSAVLAWRGRVAVYDGLSHRLDAAETLRAWLTKEPDDNALRVEAMERFDALGRKDIALELARDGVRNAPGSGEARLALGMALHESGNERASLLELRNAQRMLHKPEQRARIGALISALRARAPDSLRAIFTADSLAHQAPAPADSSPRRPAR